MEEYMNKGLKIGILIIVVAVLAGGAAWALTGNDNDTTTKNNTASEDHDHDESTHTHSPETLNQTAEQNSNETVAATITYTKNGFEPNNITVKSGEKIKIVNNSGSQLEFSSDPHPTHTNNPELNAGDTENGQSTTITLTKTGKWGFHNHYNPSDHGFVTVE
jgi:plastocyanin